MASSPRALRPLCLPLLALCLQTSALQAAPPVINPPNQSPPTGPFQATPDGKRFYDAKHDVTWLADANLAATNTFGVSGINPSGSMNYKTAQAYIAAMNKAAYLGRTDWTLPITFSKDPSCDRENRHRFGWGCQMSPLVSLFRRAFGLPDYATAVPIPPNTVTVHAGDQAFRNFQPYLYWAGSHNVGHDENENGMVSFSFNNGFQGANVARNRLYVLPMVKGKIDINKKLARKLKSPYVVYDSKHDITWLADANYAAIDDLGVPDIAPTGAMRHPTAEKWVEAMNKEKLLGSDKWQLPRSPETDTTCSAKDKFGYGCRGSDLGGLYHETLKLKRGEYVVKAPDTAKPPFLHNVEPYLYWSCHAQSTDKHHCATNPDLPAENFGWSFSFGNGFQGTTLGMNDLYVWPYHPGPPTPAAAPAQPIKKKGKKP